jgi:hypothetical protein
MEHNYDLFDLEEITEESIQLEAEPSEFSLKIILGYAASMQVLDSAPINEEYNIN